MDWTGRRNTGSLVTSPTRRPATQTSLGLRRRPSVNSCPLRGAINYPHAAPQASTSLPCPARHTPRLPSIPPIAGGHLCYRRRDTTMRRRRPLRGGREKRMKLGFFTMPVHPPARSYVETLKEDREA